MRALTREEIDSFANRVGVNRYTVTHFLTDMTSEARIVSILLSADGGFTAAMTRLKEQGNARRYSLLTTTAIKDGIILASAKESPDEPA